LCAGWAVNVQLSIFPFHMIVLGIWTGFLPFALDVGKCVQSFTGPFWYGQTMSFRFRSELFISLWSYRNVDTVWILDLRCASVFGVLFLHDSGNEALSCSRDGYGGEPFVNLTFAYAAKVGEFIPSHFCEGQKLPDAGLHIIHARIFRIQKNLARPF
jgi:hypothetical protein